MPTKPEAELQIEEDREFGALCARVEAAHAWTPRAKARFVKQTIVMIRELLVELEWRAAVVSDLHDDVYPGCGRECCAEGGGECTTSDRLAGEDSLVMTLAGLYGFLDEHLPGAICERLDLLPDLDAPLWDDLERRLVKAPKRSSRWVQQNREWCREEATAMLTDVRAEKGQGEP
jgi:hypothetical protein